MLHRLSLLVVACAVDPAVAAETEARTQENFVTFATLQPFTSSQFTASEMEQHLGSVASGFDTYLADASENCGNDVQGMYSSTPPMRNGAVEAMTLLVVQMGMLGFDYAKNAGEKSDEEQEAALEVFSNVCNTMTIPRKSTNISSTGKVVCLEIDEVETHWCMPEACIEVPFLPSMAGIKGVEAGDMHVVPKLIGCNANMLNVSKAARSVLGENIATAEFVTTGATLPPLEACLIENCSTTAREIVVIVIFAFIGLLCALTIKSLCKARVCKDCSKTAILAQLAQIDNKEKGEPLQASEAP